MQTTILVYGTLKRGGRFHNVIEESGGVLLSANAETLEAKFALWSLEYYPAVIKGDDKVRGELYSVDTLERIDRVEGHPDLFYRKWVSVVHDGRSSDAWLYLLRDSEEGVQRSGGVYIPGGFWTLPPQ